MKKISRRAHRTARSDIESSCSSQEAQVVAARNEGRGDMKDASPAPARPLVDITPETLVFELHPNAQPGCPLYIRNSSDVTIAFKVKTTEPRRYLVRPNQGVVAPGETGPVNVYLIAKECAVLLKTPSALNKVGDKFLVQSVALGDMEAAMISSVATSKQAEALSKVWTTFSKSAISNKKLNVQVSLSRGAAQGLNAAIPGTETGLSPARMAGANPAAFASPSHRAGSPPAAPVGARGYDPDSGRRGDVGRGGGGGGLEDDSRMLAHKYEDLVNYTANLTEERDDLNQSLEEAKKALQREMATRIALESKGQLLPGRKGSGRGDGGVRQPPSHQRGGSGFGWGTLAFVAVLFFFLGHWLDFASAGTGGGGSGSSGARSVGGAAPGFGKASPPAVMRDVKEGEGESYISAAAAAGLSTREDAGNPPPRDG